MVWTVLFLIQPITVQTTVLHRNKPVAIILRVGDENNQLAVRNALQVALGDVGPTVKLSCDRPTSRLINEGRLPTNCTEP